MSKDNPKGKIVSVVGVVADVYFANHIPETYSAIETMIDGHKVVLEVQSHLGGGVVRTVAMTSTEGMYTGLEAVDTMNPIYVPVGEAVLGHPVEN